MWAREKSKGVFWSTHPEREARPFLLQYALLLPNLRDVRKQARFVFLFWFLLSFPQSLELSASYFADSFINISCIKTWQADWAESHLVDWNAGMPYIFQCKFLSRAWRDGYQHNGSFCIYGRWMVPNYCVQNLSVSSEKHNTLRDITSNMTWKKTTWKSFEMGVCRSF